MVHLLSPIPAPLSLPPSKILINGAGQSDCMTASAADCVDIRVYGWNWFRHKWRKETEGTPSKNSTTGVLSYVATIDGIQINKIAARDQCQPLRGSFYNECKPSVAAEECVKENSCVVVDGRVELKGTTPPKDTPKVPALECPEEGKAYVAASIGGDQRIKCGCGNKGKKVDKQTCALRSKDSASKLGPGRDSPWGCKVSFG